jgi:septum formation protein
MGVAFQIVPSHAPELEHGFLTPRELSQLNAYRKARVVAKQHPDSLVLAADTLVCLGSVLFGKPASFEDAERILARLEGRSHQVVTGVCLIHLRHHRQRSFAESTDVTFRPLDARQIRAYLERIDPLDKAGAYAIQEHGDWIVERIDGSFSNVVGLPAERLQAELEAWPGD